MVDVMQSSQRSALMSRIRAKDTTPELQVRSMLWREGYRFRLHPRELPGRPDIVLPKWRAVVLVNGCFWHAHENCRLFRIPATRTDFWRTKLEANRQRDMRVIKSLQDLDWRIAVVWECALRDDPGSLMRDLAAWVRKGVPFIEISAKGGAV